MTTRHGTPACGTDRCYACTLEQTDGRPRRWVDAGQFLDEPPDRTAPRFTAETLATLDLDDHDTEGTP